MEHIIDWLAVHSRDIPDQVFCSFLDGLGQATDSLTFCELHERSNYLAARLRETGKLGFGQSALLVYAPGLDFIVSFMACAKIGAIPVPVPPPEPSGLGGGAEKLLHVARDSGARIALTDDALMRQQKQTAENCV